MAETNIDGEPIVIRAFGTCTPPPPEEQEDFDPLTTVELNTAEFIAVPEQPES